MVQTKEAGSYVIDVYENFCYGYIKYVIAVTVFLGLPRRFCFVEYNDEEEIEEIKSGTVSVCVVPETCSFQLLLVPASSSFCSVLVY